MSRRQTDVAVRGGLLHTGVWESPGLGPEDPAARTVLAVHGVTSSHLAWTLVADRLTATPGTRVIAPDLRGRGRSNHLPGPWGMDQHADDLLAVTRVLGRPDLTIGHSMGGFVVVVGAYRHPGRFGELLLLDGGVPLPFPVGVPIERVLAEVLGPGGTLQAAWDSMTTPPVFLRAPRGLLAQPPGLYPELNLAAFAQTRPGFTWEDVAQTNHYSLVLSPTGADRVRDTVRTILGQPAEAAVT